MREIKFRAWEPETEMGKPGNMSYNRRFCLSQILNPDGMVIMQFTGLLDKNGKEIYEGDILNFGPWEGAAKGEGLCLHIVRWSEERAAFETYEPRLEKMAYPGLDEGCCEVIGNVYENPELLKVSA